MAPVNPRLSELPEELITNISIKLGSDDVFAFRLTCKALEQRSFHEFANEYFSEKCFMLTTESLKVLTRIAESDRLRHHLLHIYIVPALFSERMFNCCDGNGCVGKFLVRHSEAMRGYVEDQKALKDSGRDLQILTQAFSKLPALNAITFADSYSSFPSSVDLRGATSSTRRTSSPPTTLPQYPGDKEFYRHKNYAWKTLIRAIANSGITSLQRLYTKLHNAANPLELCNLNLDAKTLDALSRVTRGMKTLCLQISSVDGKNSDEASDGIDTVKGAQIMERFARVMPTLEELALTFSYSPSSGVLCQNFTANIDLSKLKSLNLHCLHIDVKSLTITLLKAVSLEALLLGWLDLTEGSWPTVLSTLLQSSKLSHLHLLHLHEASRQARFLKPKQESGRRNGSPFDDFFNDFVNDRDDEEDDDSFDDEYNPDDTDYADEDEDSESSDDEDMPPLLNADGTIASTADDESVQGELDSEFASDSDSEMPPLESQDSPAANTNIPVVPPITLNGLAALQQSNNPHGAHQTNNSHSKAATNHPSDDPTCGCGFHASHFICLQTIQRIQQCLPIFIKEYNLGDSDDDDDNFLAALGVGPPGPGHGAGVAAGAGPGGLGAGGGQGGNMNNFLNALGTAFGMGPPTNVAGNAQNGTATFIGPMPPPPPPPGAVGGLGAVAGVGVGMGPGQGVPGGAAPMTFAAYGPFAMPPPPPPPMANPNAQAGAERSDAEDEEDDGRWSENES